MQQSSASGANSGAGTDNSVSLADVTADRAEDISALLGFFHQLDGEEPLARLMIAGSVIAVSLISLVVTRLLIGRRVRHLESLIPSKFKPLRWQAQDLVSSEDMKNLWCSLWRAINWGITAIFS